MDKIISMPGQISFRHGQHEGPVTMTLANEKPVRVTRQVAAQIIRQIRVGVRKHYSQERT